MKVERDGIKLAWVEGGLIEISVPDGLLDRDEAFWLQAVALPAVLADMPAPSAASG